MTGASSAIDPDVDRTGRASAAFAWLTVFFAVWLVGAVVAAIRAANRDGLGSPPFQQAIDTLDLGLTVLGVVCLAVVLRAVRRRRPWRRAFPPGYGALGAGLVVLLLFVITDRGWAEGVADPQGIEGLLAPTRVLLVIGLVLVACGPLRAALSSVTGVPRWASVLSAALALTAVLLPGGFHPAVSSWLERPSWFPRGELWLMDRDGSHQTRLVTAGDRVGTQTAAWSPDGSEIAFTRVRFGDHSPADDEADVWVADADGSHSRPVVEGRGYKWLPHWSPDGIWIVYTGEPPGGPWMASGPRGIEGAGGQIGLGYLFGQPSPVREYAHIWRIRADGTGSPEQLTNVAADDRAATYSPDGTQLAFDSTRDGTTRVYVMDADGSDARRLTGGGDDWGATWSPDGRWIAYKSWVGPLEPDPQIWVMMADGRPGRQLTSGPGARLAPSWSPDGSRIAFAFEAPDELSAIWSVALDGSDLRNLTNDANGEVELTSGGGAWGKDGRIVYTRIEPPPVVADRLVSEDLAVAAILVAAFMIALVSVLTARIGPPFGAFAVILGISTLALAITSGEWRFVPAMVAGGLIVDLLVWISPERWKAVVAGAGSAAALVVGATLAVALTSARLGWSPTLLSGVVVASVVLGVILAEVVGPRRPAGSTA